MNNSELQSTLFTALERILRPMARILINNGVTFKAFSDLARRIFIEVAENDFKVDGKKQTDSRIATITGLSRKEVKKLKAEDKTNNGESVENYNRAARVVYGWTHDAEFTGNRKKSAVLKMSGDNNSFHALVKKYSGDMPPRTVLDELTRGGVVKVLDGGRVKLLSHAYIPTKSEIQKLRLMGIDVAGLLDTFHHNIYEDGESPYFQRKVLYDNLPIEEIESLRLLLKENGQKFLDETSKNIAKRDRDTSPDVSGSGRKEIGVGLYYFERDFSEENR